MNQVAIIGAGPAGVSAAVALKDRGVSPLLIERAPHIGASWRNRYDRLKLNGTLAGFALAHTVLAAPFAIFAVLAALYRFDADLELAALSCGAGRLRAFWHVTLPMILPGVLSGAVFAFII